MTNKKIMTSLSILIFTVSIMSCSSQEYTTAKLAIQQSDFSKAAEWLPQAMAVEPDNPEIPMVMAIEVHAQNGNWGDMVTLFERAMQINAEKVIEIRGAFRSFCSHLSCHSSIYLHSDKEIIREPMVKHSSTG